MRNTELFVRVFWADNAEAGKMQSGWRQALGLTVHHNRKSVTPHQVVVKGLEARHILLSSGFSGLRVLMQRVAMLAKEAESASDSQKLVDLQQRIGREDVKVELSSELVNCHVEVKHCLLPRRGVTNDEAVMTFGKRFQEALSTAMPHRDTHKRVDSASPPKMPDALTLNGLNRLRPPVDVEDPKLFPTLSIFIGDVQEAFSTNDPSLDRLSRVVSRIEAEEEHPFAKSACTPMWLGRIDRAALQRYMRELTDGLIGSVEAAFESGDTDSSSSSSGL